MSKRIIKVALEQRITDVPKGKVLLVAQQNEMSIPTLWLEVDLEVDSSKFYERYELYGTGEALHDNRVHVGSAVCGVYVWHVYRLER